MNPELLAMLLDYLRTRDTSGAQDMGGEIPYDDYNMQGTIGGLGAYDGPVAEDWADTGISGSGWGTGANTNSATQPYFAPPEMAQYSGGRPLGTPVPEIARLLQQMQQGADYGAGSGMQGLFGGGGPQIERPQMQPPTGGMTNTAPYRAPSEKDRDRAVAPRQASAPNIASNPVALGKLRQSAAPAPSGPRLTGPIQAAKHIAAVARPTQIAKPFEPAQARYPYRAPAQPARPAPAPARTVNPVGAARNIMKPRSR